MNSVERSADVVVIGGGPAGMSAALWSAELGLETMIVEKHPAFGGQLRQIYNRIENYPGVRARNGEELLSSFLRTIKDSGFSRVCGAEAAAVDPEDLTVTLADTTRLKGRALIIATGVRRRTLGIPGEDRFVGKGIIASGVRDRDQVRDKRVLVVGGGDAAIENALLLSELARSVTVAYRAARPRARKEFLSRIADRPNVRLKAQTVVTEIKGDKSVCSVMLSSGADQAMSEAEIDVVLIRIGVTPNSEFVRSALELDPDSYIKVNSLGETSRPGIYAAGDVAHPIAPTISTATGTAAISARSVFRFLESKKRS